MPLLLGFLLGLAGLSADVVPGSGPKEWPTNPERHVISVRRQPDEKAALEKIAIAEKAPTGTNGWAGGTRLGIRLPHALTGKALGYYEELVRGYQKRSWKGYVEPRSSLEYTATLAHHDEFRRDGRTFRGVDVVELKLRFHADFTEEATQGIHFTKERTVVLDRKGRVLAVFGDGPVEAPVLAI